MSPRFAVVTLLLFAMAAAYAAQDKTAYPRMAPLEQYLMARDAEVALARSAAPDSISRDARIVVLGRHGYETAVEGKNGFVCSVERSWMSPFDNSEFWNPKIRGAVCYNPPAARSVLPIVYLRTELVLAGVPKAQLADRIKAAYAKRVPSLEPGAMSYMMSKTAYLTDRQGHNAAHVMFYTPLMDGAAWGADLPKSPISLIFHGAPEPIDVFMILTDTWSDGTPASSDHHKH
jgi:hypothetical protein